MTPDPSALARGYRLALGTRPRRGLTGNRFGRRSGSSLEFMELRDYQPGDDLRHVDWRSFARTEQLHTRLYQEEISATFELVLDGSRSMELTPDKAAATRWLTTFLASTAAPDFQLRAVLGGDPPRPLPPATLADDALPGVAFHAEHALDTLPLGGLLRPGTVRAVISDFLFPHDPDDLLERLGRGSGALLLLAVLDRDEIDPGARGSLRLRQVEGGSHQDLTVDDSVVARYRQRLDRLWEGLDRAARRRGACLARCNAGEPLEQFVSRALVEHGVVEPR